MSGTVSVTADASDDVGVAGVQFKLDGSNLGAEDTLAPYSVSWDTRTSPNGSHSISAVARDAAGNTQTASTVAVSVSNDTAAPTVPTNLNATAVLLTRRPLLERRYGQRRCRGLSGDPQRQPDCDHNGHDVQRHRGRAADHLHVLGRGVRCRWEHLGWVRARERNDPVRAADGQRPRGCLPLQRGSRDGHRRRLGERQRRDARERAGLDRGGKYGGAINFDGANDYVRVADSASLDLGRTGTVEAWVKLDTLNRWQSVVAKGSANSDPSHNYAIELSNSNRWICILGNGTSQVTLQSASAATANRYYHVACVWDGTTARLYVDGVLSVSSSQPLTPAGNAAPLSIGQFGGDADRFDGVIDELRIYGRALSAAEVQNDMSTPIP